LDSLLDKFRRDGSLLEPNRDVLVMTEDLLGERVVVLVAHVHRTLLAKRGSWFVKEGID